jgi:hypothetical protein
MAITRVERYGALVLADGTTPAAGSVSFDLVGTTIDGHFITESHKEAVLDAAGTFTVELFASQTYNVTEHLTGIRAHAAWALDVGSAAYGDVNDKGPPAQTEYSYVAAPSGYQQGTNRPVTATAADNEIPLLSVSGSGAAAWNSTEQAPPAGARGLLIGIVAGGFAFGDNALTAQLYTRWPGTTTPRTLGGSLGMTSPDDYSIGVYVDPTNGGDLPAPALDASLHFIAAPPTPWWLRITPNTPDSGLTVSAKVTYLY